MPQLSRAGYCTSGQIEAELGPLVSGGRLSRQNVSTCADAVNGMEHLLVVAPEAIVLV